MKFKKDRDNNPIIRTFIFNKMNKERDKEMEKEKNVSNFIYNFDTTPGAATLTTTPIE